MQWLLLKKIHPPISILPNLIIRISWYFTLNSRIPLFLWRCKLGVWFLNKLFFSEWRLKCMNNMNRKINMDDVTHSGVPYNPCAQIQITKFVYGEGFFSRQLHSLNFRSIGIVRDRGYVFPAWFLLHRQMSPTSHVASNHWFRITERWRQMSTTRKRLRRHQSALSQTDSCKDGDGEAQRS